ncbi:MAG: helical backbone metal receptor [Daejeonella sp.]
MNRLFTDQLGRNISVSYPPCRIISLVPSQTELLFDLGLDEEIVGITKFCIHPQEMVKNKLKTGGTKKLDLTKIRELKPDLIIGNKEENTKDQIEQLMKEFPVWMSDITNLDSALQMIREVGILVGKDGRAKYIADEIIFNFNSIDAIRGNLRIAYFIWKDPYIVAGKQTFIDDMINRLGCKNAFELERYPQLNVEDIRKVSPDVIFLSSEPYPFKEKHIKEFHSICPNTQVLIVDGELFSWYGSRLKLSPPYFTLLQKEIMKNLNTI